MTFLELRNLLYWAVDNGRNVEDTAFLHDGNDGRLINAALRDLVDCLHIVRTDSTRVPDTAGRVTLPEDMRDILLVRWGEHTRLTPINNVLLAAVGSGGVTQFMLSGRATMQLYDVPIAPLQPLHITYQAYPPVLVNDTDVPSEVPPEYREALASVYAKAQFVHKLGDFNQYRQLMGWWNVLKKEIAGVIDARTRPEKFDGAWRW